MWISRQHPPQLIWQAELQFPYNDDYMPSELDLSRRRQLTSKLFVV